MTVSIHSLWLYPVKSLAGFEVDKAVLTPKGLLGDRIWMVVKPCGTMLTQRKAPQMACIEARFTQPDSPLTSPILLIDTRDNSHITVPQPTHHGMLDTSVHGDTCPANIASDIANAWITQKINANMRLKLVAFNQQQARNMTNPARFGSDATHFADAAPFLVANKHSVDAINKEMDVFTRAISQAPDAQKHTQVGIPHFRPNIVIEGLRAFDEHNYTSFAPENKSISAKNNPEFNNDPLSSNNVSWRISLIDHCQRCSMITNNPQTGVMQKSPLFQIIARLNPMPNNPKAPAFGVNATVTLPKNASNITVSKHQPLQLLV